MTLLRKSTALIALIWLFFLGVTVVGTNDYPGLPLPAEFPLMTATIIILMPLLFFCAMSFWAPQSPFYHPKLAQLINRYYGNFALESFLVRLKPLLLFAAAATLQGLLGIAHAHRIGATQGMYVVSGFFLSVGIAFALSHVILYLRKAVGVFPTWTDPETASLNNITQLERKSLREALRLYWKALIGLALFPALLFLGGEFLHVPFEFLVLPFFAVGLIAAWPYLSGKAPYSYIFVAGLVWLMGGFFAMLLSLLVRTMVK